MTSPAAINPHDLASGGRQPPDTSARDALLAKVVDEYLAACRAGQRPDVETLIARHPEIADDLAACLASLDFLENIGEQERLLGGEGASAGQPAKSRVEGTLGDYRILGEIGRGGMGVVYEAQQISLQRRVALKVLPFAAILDDRAKKRFQNEALAAAQLDHPHIVDVYGVGCERGVHYYAMRLIDGRSLAEIVQHLREQLEANPKYTPSSLAHLVSTCQKTTSTAADADQKTLTLNPTLNLNPSSPAPSPQSPAPSLRTKLGPNYFRAIATLGMHVAEALDHAHEQGVLHRDIKPSNLVLDSAGKVWITDFGLARLDSAASLTQTGDLLGTLRYMSPEQALGKRVPIDHRSDIYSLGVTLYELLTRRPAFDGENRGELLRRVAFEEPARPRQIDPLIPPDLETIISKAIEKNPADRYATSRGLADDLKNWLESKPIKAKPVGVQDRLLRFAKRNSVPISGAFALTLIIAAVLGIAFVLTFKARNDAVAKGQELQQQHEQTVVILGRVNKAVDSMLERLSNLPTGDATRQAIIEEEVQFYRQLQDVDTDNATASHQLAMALHRMGHLQIDLARFDAAETNLQKAIAIFEGLSRNEPNSPVHANSLCHAWMNLGRVQVLKKDDDAAIQSFRRSIKHGENATRISPKDTEYRMALAFPWGQLGMLLAKAGKSTDAKAAHEREIELHQQNVASRPDHWQYRLVHGAAIFLYASTLNNIGDREEAVRKYDSAIACYQILHRERPDDWMIRTRLASFYMWRAAYVHGMDRPVDRASLEQAVSLMPQDVEILNGSAWYLARHPKSSNASVALAAEWAASAVRQKPASAAFLNTLGLVQYRQGKFTEALASLGKSRELGTIFGYDAIIQAMCFERLDQHDRAVALYLEATAWARQQALLKPDFSSFCREAAGLLGLTESPSP